MWGQVPPAPAPGRRNAVVISLLAAVVAVAALVVFGLVFLGHKTSPTSTASDAISTTTTVGSGSQSTPSTQVAGDTFVDPNGLFTIDTDPSWKVSQALGGIPAWTLGTGAPGFADNISVVSQTAPFSPSLDEAIDQDVKGLENALNGVKVLSQEKITLANGQPAGLIVVENGMLGSGEPIQQQQVVAVNGRHLVFVTVSTRSGDPQSVFDAASPYVLSLDVH